MTQAQDQPARDRRWALIVGAVAMAITMVPYLIGLSLLNAGPQRAWFSWLGYNLDDSCVYLSWMRQAAEGRFFQRNLFTTDPQLGHQFNLFFLVLGWIAGLAHIPLLAMYHLARVLLGVAFLRAVWWLIESLVADGRARRACYVLVCFSAGLGWIWPLLGMDAPSPVDAWQPEAITFLCLYQSPLFLVSLLLMVGVLGGLWEAERTRRWQPVWAAGLCGLLLGNVHGYDVITLMAIWGVFLIVRSVAERRFDAVAWLRAVVVGAMTAVSAGYMYYLVRHEDVFAKRAAVPTMSPDFRYYVLGYGLLVPLALWGLSVAWRARDRGDRASMAAPILLAVWAVVNMAVTYLPLAFQRKLLMGEHLPVAILAGLGIAHVLRPLGRRAWTAGIVVATMLLGLTNVSFMWRDVSNFLRNRGQSLIHRPYMYDGEVATVEWLAAHTPRGTTIQPLPWIVETADRKVAFFDTTLACFTPGLTGRPVNAGHWGETPDFASTMGQWVRFQLPWVSDEWREDLLRRTGVRYIVFTQMHDEINDAAQNARLLALFRENRVPPFLRRIRWASNVDATAYEVVLPAR